MRRIGSILALVAVMAAAWVLAGPAMADPGNGCPGFQNSAQAKAGSRNELVALFKENALPGQNFGDIQTEFNNRVCGHGNP
jgi:hypothetical protein